MTVDVESEAAFCDRYAKTFDSDVYREVAAGNLVFKQFTDVSRYEGVRSYAIDLLAEHPDVQHPTLVECKPQLNFRSIGQIFLYSYLFNRDRELVRRKYTTRNQPWKTKSAVQQFTNHIKKTADGYVPKPSIEDFTQQIAVGIVETHDTNLIAAANALDIEIVHEETGKWRVLNQNDLFTIPSSANSGTLKPWLMDKSKSQLDSELENEIATYFLDYLRDHGHNIEAYYEIPVGARAFPNTGTSLHVDLVVNVDGEWLVVEVKSGEGKNTTQKFQTAFGQAVGYAALFGREWGLNETQVCPVVLQLPPDESARWYTKDRYDESAGRMWDAGFQAATEPMIFHLELKR